MSKRQNLRKMKTLRNQEEIRRFSIWIRLVRTSGLICAISILCAPLAFGNYSLDQKHFDVGFKVKHLMISDVRGSFKKVEGTFNFDEKKGSLSDVMAKIETASVDTADVKRDEHLASADFFDVKNFPHMEFKSTESIALKLDKAQKLKGTLTLRGVTKPVVLTVTYKGSMTDPWGNKKIGFSAETKIDRQDFGIKWNKGLDKGGVVVGNEVRIFIDGEAGLKPEEPKT